MNNRDSYTAYTFISECTSFLKIHFWLVTVLLLSKPVFVVGHRFCNGIFIFCSDNSKGKSVPIEGRGAQRFQEVKVPRLRDNGPGWW